MSKNYIFTFLFFVFLIFFAPIFYFANADPGELIRLSVNTNGTQADYASSLPSISANGDVIAFASDATNLVEDEIDWSPQVYVRNMITGKTSIVSKNSFGEILDGPSTNPSISADGRYIVYESLATNIIDNDTNGYSDIFVYDTLTDTTSRISLGQLGDQAVGGDSTYPAISANGRFIAYMSEATNLFDQDFNSASDIFVYDAIDNTTTAVSVYWEEDHFQTIPFNSYSPSISSDGRYVAYWYFTGSYLLSTVEIRDLEMETTKRIEIMWQGEDYIYDVPISEPSISGDGKLVAFIAHRLDKNLDKIGYIEVIIYDLNSDEHKLISSTYDGSFSDGDSILPTISLDNRFVVFQSGASNLVHQDENNTGDIFMYDLKFNKLAIISRNTLEVQGNSFSSHPVVSQDGSFVVFDSYATNLIESDTNSTCDVFRKEILIMNAYIYLPLLMK
jgi:Tol biopolymer transport system component